MFEKSIYTNRRKALKKLVSNGIGIFLGNTDTPMNYSDNIYKFRQDSTFLYFFGIDQPGLAAIIDFESGDETLFGNDISIEDIIWMGHLPALTEFAEKTGIHKTQPLSKLNDVLKIALLRKRQIHILPPYRASNKLFLGELLQVHPNQVSSFISETLIKAVIKLRSVKEQVEINEIEKACAIGYEMHVTAMKMAVVGEKEQNIAGIIEGIPLKYGGHYSFPVILSQNGQTLHNHDHSHTLTKGRLMLTDAGAESAMHYASDFTRTTPINGRFSTQQREIYQIVLDANNLAAQMAKPGITYQSVHLAVAKIMANGLKNLGLMNGNVDEAVKAGAHALFFPHGLGHMMGLDVHDMEDLGQIYVGYDEKTRPINQFGTAYLRLGRELEPGFVITNEPGLYFIPALIDKWKAEKLHTDFINYEKLNDYYAFGGIRLEDDLLITNSGCRVLGERVPINIEDVENIVGR